MPLNHFYTMVQKSQKWPKTQIKGGGGPALTPNKHAGSLQKSSLDWCEKLKIIRRNDSWTSTDDNVAMHSSHWSYYCMYITALLGLL